jgi:spermidine/putrescine transport system ATP-binding protein
MSDHVAVMNEGRFVQVGTPQELYFNPQTAFVAGFVGDSNRWRGRVEDADATSVKVVTDDDLPLIGVPAGGGSLARGDSVEIFVRPESILLGRTPERLGAVDNRIRCRVDSVLFDGANSRILVRHAASGHEIVATLPQTGAFADLARGSEVHLGWTLAQAKCFLAGNGAPEPLAP